MSRSAKAGKDGAGILDDGARLAEQALQFVRYSIKWAQAPVSEYHLRSIVLYPPSSTRAGQWMVVGKGWYGGYKMVAFHRSSDALTALTGFLAKWWVGKLDWKKDQFDQ